VPLWTAQRPVEERAKTDAGLGEALGDESMEMLGISDELR
jgi:hypothetical protein